MIPARCSYLTDTYGITAVTDASEAIKAADMVLVGVNPPQISSVTSILKTILRLDTIVLSYACGVAISVFEEQLGSDKKSCASCLTPSVSLATGIRWLTVMKTSARTIKLSSTSCSRALERSSIWRKASSTAFRDTAVPGPLWVYKFIEAMIDAGIYVVFTRAEGQELILENMLGVVKVLQGNGASPTAKIEELTSPGGVTIEALRALQENGSYLTPTIASMEAAVKKMCNCGIVRRGA